MARRTAERHDSLAPQNPAQHRRDSIIYREPAMMHRRHPALRDAEASVRGIARRYAHLLAPLLSLLLLSQMGCGGEAKPMFRTLPANIMAQPRGTIGVITHQTSSSLLTAFRAMGIPYQLIPIRDAARRDLASFQILFLDEDVLEEDKEFAAYNHALEQVGHNGATMIIMHQPTDAITDATRKASYKFYPRDVEYRLLLATPRKEDPMMTTPNRVTRVDLDSLGTRASQLVHGGRGARAIISANLDAPDSSAVMLWEPYAKGAVWYFSIPLADFAAAGHEAAQKIIANLVTNK